MRQKAFSEEVKVDIHGTPTPIRWNFTAALRFMDYVDRSTDDDETFLDTVLSIWYPQVPEDRDLALTRAIEFYCGGTAPGEGYYSPVFTPGSEEKIREAFLRRYGIDLYRDDVHWWTFRRLLRQIGKETTT